MGRDGIYTEKDIISICEDFLERKYELKEKGAIEGIELDYHITREAVYGWLQIYFPDYKTMAKKPKEVKKVVKKETVQTVKYDKNNLEKLFYYDEVYTENKDKSKDIEIRKFYTNVLKVADGVNLDEEDAKKELDKLFELLTTDTFKTRYGRDFTLVDMYLTTNLSINDLLKNYYGYMDNVQRNAFLEFIAKQIKLVDNPQYRNHDILSKLTISRRFSAPVKKNINKIINLDSIKYNGINATTEDAVDAYLYFEELNSKYGVKYDDISFHIVFREYMNAKKNNIYPKVFDAVAIDYKDELDKLSHVVDRSKCSRVLTRREKNK
ncbi:MAG: hypothetical protein IKX00_03355 [Bacilli bacterium]|nr:hypothetical protein [Bacilli bacterium]